MLKRHRTGSQEVQEGRFFEGYWCHSFSPHTEKRRGDILVVDPDGNAEPRPSDAQFRNLLLHYVPIFTVQGDRIAAFGRRLKEIANGSDQEFANYLLYGDNSLYAPSLRRGRSGFNWKGTRYVGTFFDDCVWPEWLTGMPTPSKGGCSSGGSPQK